MPEGLNRDPAHSPRQDRRIYRGRCAAARARILKAALKLFYISSDKGSVKDEFLDFIQKHTRCQNESPSRILICLKDNCVLNVFEKLQTVIVQWLI